MWLLIKLAARNLRKNLRRTLITSSAIVVGLVFLMFGTVMQDGQHRDAVRSAVGFMAGHVVVQGQGYNAERDKDIRVKNATVALHKLRAVMPQVTIAPRMFVGGLLSSPEGSMGVGLSGVDPTIEKHMTDMDDRIVEGTYLTDDTRDILVGKTLTESLGVGLGDKVVLMMQHDGEIENRLFRVRGIYKTGATEFDGFYAIIHIKAAQELLHAPDEVHQLALLTDYEGQLEETRILATTTLARDDIEVLTWPEALPEIYDYIVLDDVGMWVMLLLIGFIVAIGILNTMLMSVLERIREFGTMLALGMSPARLASMILLEGVLLGAFAATLGIVLGVAINYPVVTSGIDYSGIIGGETMEVAGVAVSTMIYGYYDWAKYPVFWLITVGLTTSAALYPVWFTSRLTPTKAMHHR